MRLSLVLPAAAYVALFVGGEARAVPFSQKYPDAPIDPCELDPAARVPEPDPCDASGPVLDVTQS